MTTQITRNAMASDLGQRRQTIGGRLATSPQLRGVVIIAALVLALAASLALVRALGADQAGSPVSLPSVGNGPGLTAYREDHRAAVTTSVPGFAETREDYRIAALVIEPGFTNFREDHRVPVAVATPGFTDYREDHRTDGESDLPGFTDYREDHRP